MKPLVCSEVKVPCPKCAKGRNRLVRSKLEKRYARRARRRAIKRTAVNLNVPKKGEMMITGSIDDSPDYKSEKPKPLNPRIKITPEGRPYVEIKDLVSSALRRIRGTSDPNREVDRARLERNVIEKAKAYGRAARATEEHMKKSTEEDRDPEDGWRLLRDLESTWEDLMLNAVDALLELEQKHGIKQ